MNERPISAPTREKAADTDPLWTYFDRYKNPGSGAAVERPKFDSFRHVSDETKTKDHLLLAKKMNRPFLRQRNTVGPDAFAFESFLTSEAMRQHWLGGKLSPTTDYDDWVSGIDAVVEWPDESGEPVRLAIDFTATNKYPVFVKKSDKLEGNVQIKYLRSQVETEGGQPKELRASLPMVILGVDSPVYRLIAERKESLTPEHPLRRLLIDQACSQIDIQLVHHTRNVFESPRAKRGKGLKELQERYLTLGKDIDADKATEFVRGLDTELLNTVMSEKDQRRFHDLARLKARLGEEQTSARSIKLDNEWKTVAERSITHRVLSE